ncbi:phage tail protein I [Xanthomonas citri pv. citri]|uniref:Phage tail protein I n=2 Tax=Xanthomonas citri TaxID=346 RepID=A0A9X6BHB0_XANCI|nr:phage tail protein I [Xanthomonas citri]MBD4834813.1 phage tail protein I [Xanthomonas citri pv. citri]MBD4863972.1 phage tail protein I [Xanthomonas citri pv. citri]PWF18649.1 tail protein [Xanthomonas citri pv. citri]QRD68816.1 phage tail protein I [Xanthomonas citri pv. citri]QRD74396.1 phage tail protein I [Xanthomonas citri pv. citri]
MSNSPLPPNATPMERALAAVTDRLEAIPLPYPDLWNPDTCPAGHLPWLAWTLSVDDWKADWSDAVKRSRLRSAMAIQRRKGTANSVRMVVESFGGAVAIREWWQTEPRGQPHTFELTLTLTGTDAQTATSRFVNEVIAEVERTKPVRSHFTFTQGFQAEARIGVLAVARPAVYRRLLMDAQ